MMLRWFTVFLGIALLGFVVYRPHTLHGEVSGQGFPPQRVVSLSLTADEILLALLPPERIVALTHLSDNPTYSNVVTGAQHVQGRVHANAEQVIVLQPDLVVLSASAYTGGTAKALLRQTGIPLFSVPWYESIAGIKESILAVGQAVGEEAKAQGIVAKMERRIRAVQRCVAVARQLRVLYFSPDGFTAGKKTNIDEMITTAGGRNIAAVAGIEYFQKISHETLVMLDPEVILLSRDPQAAEPEEAYQWLYANPALENVAALQQGRVYSVPRPYFDVSSHHVVNGVEAIARLLHPKVFVTQAFFLNGVA